MVEAHTSRLPKLWGVCRRVAGNNGKDKIKVSAAGEFAIMLGVLGARESATQFADETHGAPETVLRPDDPHSPRCNSAFARAFGLGDFLVRGISASNFFDADRRPKKSLSTLYATLTVSKSLWTFNSATVKAHDNLL